MLDPFTNTENDTLELRLRALFSAVDSIPRLKQPPRSEGRAVLWYDETNKRFVLSVDSVDTPISALAGGTTTVTSSSRNVEGGSATTVYLPSQRVNGGNANG